MQLPSRISAILVGVVLLGIVSSAVAHGHDEHEDVSMQMGGMPDVKPTIAVNNGTVTAPASYFQLTEHTGLMFAHILLMTIGWVFVLPVGVMLSIARSRYSLPVQFLFIALNAVGVFLVTIYNASTPDLYPNNAHHKIGWVLTWVVVAQVVIGVISAYAGRKSPDQDEIKPLYVAAMEEHQRMHSIRMADAYRFSNDSGQGTEPNTDSLRSSSISSREEDDLPEAQSAHEEDDDIEKQGLMHGSRVNKFLSSRLPGLFSSKVLGVLQFFYDVVDRLILILGFAALATGIVTYSGLFMGAQVFSGAAHFIKGAVFFWYGILTLGRWAGCFANIGWAWNIKPSNSNKPSAEFVESFLIFFYGSSNVFLEHLAAWGKPWSAQDLEHISITIMFFGGGLCGMLIESSRVRDLLNSVRGSEQSHLYHPEGRSAQEPPQSYKFSMNPLPALILMLLGMMMSGHHQESMVSTMIHKQWGTLLIGAAFARGLTYVIFYLAPPTSMLPGRPPSELITAFCLMAGGFIFMSSARDIVMTMELYDLDAMFIFTVTMGLITFLMAWIIVVIAIKGWAVRKERPTYAIQSGAMSP